MRKKLKDFAAGFRTRLAFEDLSDLHDNEGTCRHGGIFCVDLILHRIEVLATRFYRRLPLDLETALDLRTPDIERDLRVCGKILQRLVHEVVRDPDRIIADKFDNPDGDHVWRTVL